LESLRKDSAAFNHARNTWASTDVVAVVALNLFHDIHPLDALAENDIPSIAPRTRVGGDKELGGVGIRTPVGHREQSTTTM